MVDYRHQMQRPVVRSAHSKRLTRAGELAVAKLVLGPDVRCEIIASAARGAFTKSWIGHQNRSADWDWATLSAQFQDKHPKCFNVAIWQRETLCGLAIGTVNQDRFVALDFLEGNPDPIHPLKGKVVEIVLTMMEAFRQLIDVPELRLHHVDPNLIPLYTSQGFTVAPGLGDPHHMVRR